MRGDRFLQPAHERLEIHVRVFVPQLRVRALVHGGFLVLRLFGLEHAATAQSKRAHKKEEDDFFHVSPSSVTFAARTQEAKRRWRMLVVIPSAAKRSRGTSWNVERRETGSLDFARDDFATF